VPAAPKFTEIGRSGLRQWSGYIYDEFVPDLSGDRATRTFREMADNHPIVGGVLLAIDMLIRKVDWWFQEASDSPEDLAAKDFADECFTDMSRPWKTVSSEILSFLPFGWDLHEICYKIRNGPQPDRPGAPPSSKYTDGKIGWRKFAMRAQESRERWVFDEEGGLQGMKQWGRDPIPIDKALLFRTTAAKDNPEGRSILRNAWMPWYYQRRHRHNEAIGIERDLAGLPMLTPPDGTGAVDLIDIWDPNDPEMVAYRREAEELIRNVRRDENDGVLKPPGWEFELLGQTGRRQIDVGAVIDRGNVEISVSMLTDFLLLGHGRVGTQALAEEKTDVFVAALGAWVDEIGSVMNAFAVPRLFELNPTFRVTEHPKLMHGDIEAPNLAELGEFIKDTVGVGVMVPDPGLEDFVRSKASFPPREETDPAAAG
jgi:hypothetical protein